MSNLLKFFSIKSDSLFFKDITLSIQTNKNNLNKQIKFVDAFPLSLGDLAFTTQDTSVEYLTCTVSFRYNRFEFIR